MLAESCGADKAKLAWTGRHRASELRDGPRDRPTCYRLPRATAGPGNGIRRWCDLGIGAVLASGGGKEVIPQGRIGGGRANGGNPESDRGRPLASARNTRIRHEKNPAPQRFVRLRHAGTAAAQAYLLVPRGRPGPWPRIAPASPQTGPKWPTSPCVGTNCQVMAGRNSVVSRRACPKRLDCAAIAGWIASGHARKRANRRFHSQASRKTLPSLERRGSRPRASSCPIS